MKFIIISLCITISLTYGMYQKEFGITTLFVNDNITTTKKAGEKGNYIGADDFLTFSLLQRAYYKSYKLSLSWSIVTSRQELYRYDLLTTTVAKKGAIQNFFGTTIDFVGEVGLILRGDYGGEAIQNSWHGMTGNPKVDLSYTSQAAAFIGSASAEKRWQNRLLTSDIITLMSEIKLPSAIIPSRVALYGSYLLPLFETKWKIELLGGHRQYLNKQANYSPFVQNGYLFGFNNQIQLYKKLSLQTGVSVTPARNIITDVAYKQRDFSQFYQIWGGLSWNISHKNMVEFLNY